ncbi:hypothetical protein ILUMI_15697 [Ignelater luminosus]|uniref:Uncharacterized protein n=1 Tax=Ignelater luminosus TaxID=2038154 RepID=A0A8K0G998_IGNLU|nr:hypothetical protein ILUMI_15697 [Ignelater luminosus]
MKILKTLDDELNQKKIREGQSVEGTKRKREGEADDIFKRSKRTNRTPQKENKDKQDKIDALTKNDNGINAGHKRNKTITKSISERIKGDETRERNGKGIEQGDKRKIKNAEKKCRRKESRKHQICCRRRYRKRDRTEDSGKRNKKNQVTAEAKKE